MQHRSFISQSLEHRIWNPCCEQSPIHYICKWQLKITITTFGKKQSLEITLLLRQSFPAHFVHCESVWFSSGQIPTKLSRVLRLAQINSESKVSTGHTMKIECGSKKLTSILPPMLCCAHIFTNTNKKQVCWQKMETMMVTGSDAVNNYGSCRKPATFLDPYKISIRGSGSECTSSNTHEASNAAPIPS